MQITNANLEQLAQKLEENLAERTKTFNLHQAEIEKLTVEIRALESLRNEIAILHHVLFFDVKEEGQ
jgi:DNA repair exonuclease SbcCD ATPase subunit